MAMTGRLSIDFAACDGHGLCADLLPEAVALDEWGYPVLRRDNVSPDLLPYARRAAAACPTLALRLLKTGPDEKARGH
jgi:ferredoxin